jgi:type II secretory pathway pseudopilin PulG
MEFANEGLLIIFLILAFTGLKLQSKSKNRKRDLKMVKLQGQALSLLLQEYKENEAYQMKPLDATNDDWYYVVNTVYNPAPAYSNPF